MSFFIQGFDNVAKDFSKKFYKSTAWQECRRGYIIHKHGLCERCQRPGEIVHHKILLTESNINDPNITLAWENLELLCQDCHNKEHFEKYNDVREGLMFDGDGDLILKINSPP